MIQDVLIYYVTTEVLGEDILLRSDRSRECFIMVQAAMHVYTFTTGLPDLFIYHVRKGGPYSAGVEVHTRDTILPQLRSPEGLRLERPAFNELGQSRIRLVKDYLRYDEACGVDEARFCSLLSSMLFMQGGLANKKRGTCNVLACVGGADESVYGFIDQYWDRVETLLAEKRNLRRAPSLQQAY